MRLLYSLAIFTYSLIIKIFSIFNSKAKLWINGRKNVFEKLKFFKKSNSNPIIWVHCASLGEFEQGRPFIEKIKKEKPEYRILLTFFSPSGFEIRKKYLVADYVSYLPQDSIKNSKKFIDIISPKMVFFVKYEYWYNYINQLNRKEIPFYIISAIFRKKQIFFKWYGSWFRKQLFKISFFYTQNDESLQLLKTIGITNAIKTGDTRFDRVAEICSKPFNIEQFAGFEKSKTIVIGSSWPDDEQLIQKSMSKFLQINLIIAPHDVDEERILFIENIFKDRKCIRFSKLIKSETQNFDVVIIDSIGLLSSLYQYGFLAYIGGGFNKGIHNILEASCYGIPIVFGPNYLKFQEAVSLINEGGAFSVNNEEDLSSLISRLISNPEDTARRSLISKSFTQQNIGATEKIYSHVFK